MQGGISETMRRESAQQVVEIGFDGYGIGGLSVGETRSEMLPALAAAIEHLPTDRPRYLMGVGDPASLVEAVSLGVDQFDCVMRRGSAATGRHSPRPADSRPRRRATPNSTNRSITTVRARSAPGTAAGTYAISCRWGSRPRTRLLSIHNVAWTIDLMARMRRAIESGTFDSMRRSVLEVWG